MIDLEKLEYELWYACDCANKTYDASLSDISKEDHKRQMLSAQVAVIVSNYILESVCDDGIGDESSLVDKRIRVKGSEHGEVGAYVGMLFLQDRLRTPHLQDRLHTPRCDQCVGLIREIVWDIVKTIRELLRSSKVIGAHVFIIPKVYAARLLGDGTLDFHAGCMSNVVSVSVDIK